MLSNKKAIVEYFKLIYNKGLTTSSGGNISIKNDDILLVSPTGKNKGKLTANDIVEWDLQKQVSLNNNQPTCEIQMHTKIYEARSEVKTIIHAHPEFVSIFSVIEEKLRLDLMSEAFIFLKNIEYVDYEMPSSVELANKVGEAAKKSDVLMLRNHGVIVMGNDIEECFHKIEIIEHLAKIQFRIMGRSDICYLNEHDMNNIERKFH